jgi:hypothetical protein
MIQMRQKVQKKLFIAVSLTLFALIFSGKLCAQDSTLLKRPSHKSPTGALLRSMVVPAWGQLYNASYIKAGIIGSLESFLIYQTIYYFRKTSRYEDLYTNDTTASRYSLFLQYDKYRDLRNQHIWFLGITVFFSMFDAYVDAHLKNFNVDLTPDFDEQSQDLTLWLNVSFRY